MRRIAVLTVLLFASQLLASQGMAMDSNEIGSSSTCDFASSSAADAASETEQNSQRCSASQDEGACSISCPVPYVGKFSGSDLPVLTSSPYNFSYLSHIGRLTPGPEPFPPKIS
tara:strand:- start:166 stop:507 length:342 start_codon:yes stop_codon:yes gene_type:complete